MLTGTARPAAQPSTPNATASSPTPSPTKGHSLEKTKGKAKHREQKTEGEAQPRHSAAALPGHSPSPTKKAGGTASPILAPQAIGHGGRPGKSRNPTLPLDPEQARALQQEQAAQRTQMLEKLEALKRDIAAGEATRSEVADALASSERAISEANRNLRNLGQQQVTVQAQLADVERRRARATQNIASQQQQLAQMLHDQYLAGAQEPFRLLLSGDNPNRIQRDFQYEGYVSVAVTGMLTNLQASLAQLQDLSGQVQARNTELAAIAASQQSQRADLQKDEDQRRITLSQISEKLKNQRAEAGALERDEKRLSEVVDQLGKLIERQAREAKERERQRALAREKQLQQERLADKHGDKSDAEGERRSPNPSGADAAQGTASSSRPEAPLEAPFAGNLVALRGKLRLPVQGELAGRFGGSRAEGGPTWKGLFIRAGSGAEVHAIAPGRVVFAEWLRGFGNLLIVDHGDQYLSIYGNNESLLKQPGDIVKMGDVVATVGNSGGNPETGLYFEMRYQGKPFDPMAWIAGR